MHTRHSEVVYLDYHVVALCLLIVLARIVGAPTVYFSGSTRVLSILLKLSVLALSAILTDPGKKRASFQKDFLMIHHHPVVLTATAVTKVTMDPTKRGKLSAELSPVALSPWQRTESAPRQTDAMMFSLPNNEQLIGFRMISDGRREK